MNQPIGVFDSGYGGLTVLKEIVQKLPHYNYLYLGDNARAPYGNRSFETVYEYTLEAVKWFFSKGCPLVILACNTASAKALRTIQQNDLEKLDSSRRILGVIRPTTEVIGKYTKTNQVGILGTSGTIASGSYPIEIKKFFPGITVHQEACPMWVPLVENNEHLGEGADYFIKKHVHHILSNSADIDTLLLACTHYPLMMEKIKQFLPRGITVLSQGKIVANSLEDYLKRHSEINEKITREGSVEFYTTDSVEDFNNHAAFFYGQNTSAVQIHGLGDLPVSC
jgi:glutamate racemase